MAATWTLLGSFSVTSTQAATEAAPTLSTDGLSIDGVMALTVWLDAGSGQTISNDVGQCDIYIYDNAVWGIAPAIVLQVPPGSTGKRRVQLGSVSIENRRGRLAPICNGVVVSGANVTVDVLATLDGRGVSKVA